LSLLRREGSYCIAFLTQINNMSLVTSSFVPPLNGSFSINFQGSGVHFFPRRCRGLFTFQPFRLNFSRGIPHASGVATGIVVSAFQAELKRMPGLLL
jgi:hypothetical protein